MVFGGASSEGAGEGEVPGPRQEVHRRGDETDPGVVADDVVEGQVRQPAGFRVPDDALGSGASTLACFEGGDVGVGLVSEDALVTEPLNGVEQRQLRAGVWTLATADQPGAGRP